MVCALDLFLKKPTEVAILGHPENEDTGALLDTINHRWRPEVVLCGGSDADEDIPLLRNRTQIDGRATAYICRNFVCSEPVTDAGALEKLLDGISDSR